MKIYGVTALAVLLFAGATIATGQQSDPLLGPMGKTGHKADVRALDQLVQDAAYEGCASCDTGCDSCCRSAGFFAGAELTYLKAHNSEGFGGPLSGVRFDYEPAIRAWLGYARPDGLGIQLRIWDFDHSTAAVLPVPETHRLNLSVIDVEATNATEIGTNWDALITAGYRHVDFAADTTFGQVDTFTDHSGNDGLTVSGEMRRHFRDNLFLFGNVRVSVLFGDEVLRSSVFPDALVEDTVKYMYESQIGIEWQRPLANGGTFFARGALEVQHWDGFEPGLGGDAIGFFGGTFALGVQR